MEETHLKAQENKKKPTHFFPSCWEEEELMKLEGKYIFDEALRTVTEQNESGCVHILCFSHLTAGWIWKIFAWIKNICIRERVQVAAASVFVCMSFED